MRLKLLVRGAAALLYDSGGKRVIRGQSDDGQLKFNASLVE